MTIEVLSNPYGGVPLVPLVVPPAKAAEMPTSTCVVPQIERAEEERGDEHDFLDPPQQPDELGRLGNYRVLRLLGSGGMGTVFEAEDQTLSVRGHQGDEHAIGQRPRQPTAILTRSSGHGGLGA